MTNANAAIDGVDDNSTLLNINDSISGQGQIGTGANLTIENGPSGILDAFGGTLILDPSPSTPSDPLELYFDNSGVLEASAGARLEIEQGLLNNGAIIAHAGAAVVLDGFVDGDGAIEIRNSGLVEIGDEALCAIDFSGTGGLLVEDTLSAPSTISGFASGETIDLNALGFVNGTSTLAYAPNSASDAALGGVLTISGLSASGQAASQTLTLSGDFANANFALGDDAAKVGSHFGTVVTIS